MGEHSNGVTSAPLELDLVALEVSLVLDYFNERLQRLENVMATVHTRNGLIEIQNGYRYKHMVFL